MKESAYNEECPVCNDKVSGYHYGILTCESCKGFFKRTVQNNKKYTCVHTSKCHIDKAQRKGCQHCRYQKCLRAGMKVDAVRKNRVRGGRNSLGPLYKQDRAKKQQQKVLDRINKMQSETQSSSESSKGSPEAAQIILGDEASSLTTPSQDFPTPHLILTPSLKADDLYSPSLPTIDGSYFTNPMPQNRMCLLSERPSCSFSLPLTDPVPAYGSTPVPAFPVYNPYNARLPCGLTCLNGLWAERQPNINQNNLNRYLQALDCKSPVNESATKQGCTSDASPLESALQNCSYMPPLIRQLICAELPEQTLRERIVRALHGWLTSYHDDIFGLVSRIADQTLYAMVDWAKNSAYFSNLEISDQMRLLQSSWIELLVLDHIYRQLKERSNDIVLVTGHRFSRDLTNLPPDAILAERIVRKALDIEQKFRRLNLDEAEFVCFKYLVVFNAESRSSKIDLVQEKINEALCDYNVKNYPDQPDRIGKLLFRLSEIRSLALQIEQYLSVQRQQGHVMENTLLMEMLRAKNAVVC